MDTNKTILYAPLNWGLGHATRLAPLIQNSLNQGHNVIIAGQGAPLEFLKLEFPNIKTIELKGFNIRYAKPPFFLAYLFLQMPFFYLSIIIENYRLRKIIHKHNVTLVVSDNRYGLFSKKVKSILITHQLFIRLPKSIGFMEPMLHKITAKLILKFNECWVPDYENMNDSLSGNLSHGLRIPKNVIYIGPLSRFQNVALTNPKNGAPQFDVLVLISGPEPYRTLFERQMEQRFLNSNKKVLMVCGKPGKQCNNEAKLQKNITKVEHLSSLQLYHHLTNTKYIIARSGYSTLMDLHTLQLKAELIPTPGQTEQEYLAQWWATK